MIETLVTHDYDTEPLWLRELARHTRSGFSGLYRERSALERLGEWNGHRHAATICFTVNDEHPLTAPLTTLVQAASEMDERRGGPPNLATRPFADSPAWCEPPDTFARDDRYASRP